MTPAGGSAPCTRGPAERRAVVFGGDGRGELADGATLGAGALQEGLALLGGDRDFVAAVVGEEGDLADGAALRAGGLQEGLAFRGGHADDVAPVVHKGEGRGAWRRRFGRRGGRWGGGGKTDGFVFLFGFFFAGCRRGRDAKLNLVIGINHENGPGRVVASHEVAK